jgi:16S rRNA (guanine1207-N2)-methyltransferase
MAQSRLSLCLEAKDLILPEGPVIVFGARAEADLSALSKDRATIVQPFYPDHMAWKNRGFTVDTQVSEKAATAIVFLPRSKISARDMLAQAAQLADVIVVDGQKTDGIDSILKEVKKRAAILGNYSKAHGRLFWFETTDLGDWRQGMSEIDGGFVTAPGVFSADGVDPASKLLADTLPAKLKGRVADFGAGWGYLTSRLIDNDAFTAFDLIEADAVALDCARKNVPSDKVTFHWADATDFTLPERADVIVMNPPFHTDRKADPELGRRFIASAKRNLRLSGQLFLVANRHLPYEQILTDLFAVVHEGAGTGQFKTFVASKPRR